MSATGPARGPGGGLGDGLGRISIVGAGQVGTMIGMALSANREPAGIERIVLFDMDPEVAATSLARGAGDAIGDDVREAFDADVTLLAVPVPGIVNLLDGLGGSARAGALVLDTGSTKRAVADAMVRNVPAHSHAVGGHPMAGSERAGPGGAEPDRLRGAAFVLTPVRDDPPGEVLARRFVGAVGARPVVMDPDAHDRSVALTSHLPHLIAFALAHAARDAETGAGAGADADDIRALVSTGFLGATRLAESDPGTTSGFLSANAGPIAVAAAHFGASLDALLGALGDPAALEALLEGARSARRSLTGEVEP